MLGCSGCETPSLTKEDKGRGMTLDSLVQLVELIHGE